MIFQIGDLEEEITDAHHTDKGYQADMKIFTAKVWMECG